MPEETKATSGVLGAALALAEDWCGATPGPPQPLGVRVCAAGMLVSRNAPPGAVTATLLSSWEGTLSPERQKIITQRFGLRTALMVEALCEPDLSPTTSWSDRRQTWLSRMPMPTATVALAACALRIAWATEVVRLVAEHGPGVLELLAGGPHGALWLSRALLTTVRPAVPVLMAQRLEALCEVTESVVSAAYSF